MNYYNPLLLIDFYKVCHSSQYPKGLTKMVSYYTPRMSRLKDVDRVTFFGLQGFIKEYLVKGFNENFFNRTEDEVVEEYERVLNATMGKGTYDSKKIRNLHRLGYLPLEISAVPEGTRTAIGVPQIQITNTDPNFVWLVNTIETLLSCSMWHTQTSAEVGYRYFQIVNEYCNKTCEVGTNPHKLLGDFSMRGQQSPESAIKSSAAWCLSFLNTATVPAILWLEDNYNCDCTKEEVAYGAISTEHSVMCSNTAVDGDEVTHIKRLLTEIYPNNSFSMVSDSYDYWNLVDNILPQCHKEIMEHNGTILIRGDSGDPVEVIAGKDIIPIKDEEEFLWVTEETSHWLSENLFWGIEAYEAQKTEVYLTYKDKYYKITAEPVIYSERGGCTDRDYYFIESWKTELEEIQPTSEIMGTVWALDQQFGHTINSKGYKVLDSHVKAIYGDSITPQRCEEIYRRLAMKGYAIDNVVLGVGSFSMMCLETKEGDLSPYTRDTFSIAVKATYAEDKNGKPIMIYKQPKAASWKKSQKGCCIVYNEFHYLDNLTWEEHKKHPNLIQPVFRDGKFIKEFTLEEIRNNMFEEEGL